jgi:hypothetical protein
MEWQGEFLTDAGKWEGKRILKRPIHESKKLVVQQCLFLEILAD